MSHDNEDLMLRHPDQRKAKGGTEMMQERLYRSVPRAVLEKFQIWFSRFDESLYDPEKTQILYVHDLPGDRMYERTLSAEGRLRFAKIFFVSNWQMQQFIAFYNLKWSQCAVMRNAIEPIENVVLPKALENGKVKLIYHTTPHRGLSILSAVFADLAKRYPIELDVFSSFGVYGWPQRDAEFAGLFDQLRAHPNVNYFGAAPNTTVREAVAKAHIFAYPSIWPETSCISLMEAMSAGAIAVHPNYAALFETAGGLTRMYQMHEDHGRHAEYFYSELEKAIRDFLENSDINAQATTVQNYANNVHNWTTRAEQWIATLAKLA
jgi:UDP-glucose:(glucosyl)LPS alpha-1,2-glucosyltransferase